MPKMDAIANVVVLAAAGIGAILVVVCGGPAAATPWQPHRRRRVEPRPGRVGDTHGERAERIRRARSCSTRRRDREVREDSRNRARRDGR